MAGPYFSDLRDELALPDSFEGIATSLDDLFANIASYGITITFANPEIPPDENPDPGVPADPDTGESEEIQIGDVPPNTEGPTVPPPQTAEPELHSTSLLGIELEALSEIPVGLPGLDGVKIVINPAPFHVDVSINPIDGVLIQAQLAVAVRFDRKLLVPMRAVGDGQFEEDPNVPSVDIMIADAIVKATGAGGLDFEFGTGLTLTRPAMIGQTGVIIETADLAFNFTGEGPRPEGAPEGWTGVLFEEARVRIPAVFDGSIDAERLGFGSGGVTGTIARTFQPPISTDVLGMSGDLNAIALTFRENILTECTITAQVLIPFFDDENPLDLLITIGTDGTVTATLAGSIATLEREDIVRFDVTSITFGIEDGKTFTSMSGLMTPLVEQDVLDWPGFEVQDLRVDEDGNVTFAGGWIDLPNQATLDLYAFIFEITRIGFGKTETGENWIGFNGTLKLVDGVPASASLEGLRIIWGGPQNTPVHLTLDGVGVDLEIPGVIRFAGHVSLAHGAEKEFKGAVRVEILPIGFQVEGNFVAGSVIDEATGIRVKTYAVYLQMQLPAGIPLGPTGLAFYGVAGLYAHNRVPDKRLDEGWYRGPKLEDGWYTRGDPDGITDVGNKWKGAAGGTGLGAGIILGTFPDNGYIFNGRLLLVLVFPGPVILIEGMANLFKKRSSLGDAGDPNFRTLVVIDPGKTFTASMDAQYKFASSGQLLDIRGSAQAFFDLQNGSNWYINIGVNSPRENRVRARAFQLFDVNAFFMLDPTRVWIGAGWSYNKRFGFKHLNVTLKASMEGEAKVSWHPNHFHGSVSVSGSAELRAFGIGAGLSVTATVSGDVFNPFELSGSFRVRLNLPWPLPDIRKSIGLKWTDKDPRAPKLPVPVREVAIEHFKTRNTWPLIRGQHLLYDQNDSGGTLDFERSAQDGGPTTPNDKMGPFAVGVVPSVPSDTKVALSFLRPMSDPNNIADYLAPVGEEVIGDPEKAAAAYRMLYSLDALGLQKWAPGPEGSDGLPRWVTIRQGPTTDGLGPLVASWLPGTQDPNSGRTEQNKLLVNAVTPFDYTAERSKAWQDWFVTTNPGFPCPLALPELSARFTQPIGSRILSADFTVPQFSANWLYGGEISENDVVIPTVLGPLDRGPLATISSGPTPGQTLRTPFIFIRPEIGVTDVMIRIGSPKLGFRRNRSSFGSSPTGGAANPLTLENRFVVSRFNGRGANGSLTSQNTVVVLADESLALEVGDRLEIVPPEVPLYVEIDIEINTTSGSSGYEAFAITTDGVEGPHQTIAVGRSVVRFRGTGTVTVSQVVVRRTFTPTAFTPGPNARLRRIGWRPPFLARVIPVSGLQFDLLEPLDGLFLIHVDSPGIDSLQIVGDPYDGVTLLEMALPADNQELIRHVQSSLSRLQTEDPLFEPDSDYRMVVGTSRNTNGGSFGTPLMPFVDHAYFHVVGPPGIGAPDQPPDQPGPSQTGITGLSDLRLYIKQTLPPTIPAQGDKLLLPRAFYRGYDVAVEFDVPHTELMYLKARRSLTTRLYDVNSNPILGKDGRISIPVSSWERSRQTSLSETVTMWIGMVNGSECRPDDLPPLDPATVVQPQTLGAPAEDIVLPAETLHMVRLVPALLHETFIDPVPGLIANAGSFRLDRWIAENGGSVIPRWEIAFVELDGPPGPDGSLPKVFFVRETAVATSSLYYAGALSARPSNDDPVHWSDFRVSVRLRWASGVVGLDVRRAGAGDLVRLTLDRGGARRLFALQGGVEVALDDDVTTFPADPGNDIFITIECVGDRVQVFQGEPAELVFDVTGAPTAPGTVALYSAAAAEVRFTEVHVDDLRPTPSTAFAFDFVSSRYTNFHHHLHSFADRLAGGATATALEAADLTPHVGVSVTVPTSGGTLLPPIEDPERRAFEALEAKALDKDAIRPPDNVEIRLISAPNNPPALLVRSPEPILWERTSLEITGAADGNVPGLATDLKLTDVVFGDGGLIVERVTILVRIRSSLARHRLEWRPLPSGGTPDPAWTPYYVFGQNEPELEDGTQAHVLAAAPGAVVREPGTVQLFAEAGVHFTAPGVELRLLGPDGTTVVHQRRFLTADAFAPFSMQAVRKLDGTAILLFVAPGGGTTLPATLRLRWTFTRAFETENLRFRQGGSETSESAVLDFVTSTEV